MIERFFNLFRNKKDTEVDTNLTEIRSNLPSEVDYSEMEPINVKGCTTCNLHMLMMDDFIEQFTLYALDFNKIKRKYKYDVLNEFKVYESIGMHAGFTTNKLISEIDNLNIAILDMTLETSIKLSNGDIVEYDGVDIAISIMEKFPDCEILFCTAHSLNRRDPLMSKYIDKFETATNKTFADYYMSKADNRSEIIYDCIRKVLDKQ